MNLLTEEIAQIEKRSSSVNGTARKAPIAVPEMTFAYEPKHQSPALSLNGSTLIYRGELCTFMALPGVGKTTFTADAIPAAHLSVTHNLTGVDTLGITYNATGKKCLLCDTERTEDDNSKTYHSIFRRLGKPQSILTEDGQRIQGLTHLVMAEIGDTEKLRKALQQHLDTGEYELVILDGILDFCLSMLDDKDAMKVVKWIRALAVKHNCAIVTTIHPNKGTDSPAGHIGAFLYRWSRAFLLIRNTNDKNVKEITVDFPYAKLSHANIASFEPVYFAWNDASAMMMTTGEPAEPTYKIKFLKQAMIELRLQGHHEIPSAVLKEHYGKLAGVKSDAAKKHISRAVADGLLVSSGSGKGTKYLPASDWNLNDTTHSGTDALYIYKSAYPNGDSQYAESPNDTRIPDKGYPKEWN